MEEKDENQHIAKKREKKKEEKRKRKLNFLVGNREC